MGEASFLLVHHLHHYPSTSAFLPTTPYSSRHLHSDQLTYYYCILSSDYCYLDQCTDFSLPINVFTGINLTGHRVLNIGNQNISCFISLFMFKLKNLLIAAADEVFIAGIMVSCFPPQVMSAPRKDPVENNQTYPKPCPARASPCPCPPDSHHEWVHIFYFHVLSATVSLCCSMLQEMDYCLLFCLTDTSVLWQLALY